MFVFIYLYKFWYLCDIGVNICKYIKIENDEGNGININSWWILVKGIWVVIELFLSFFFMFVIMLN